MSDNDRKAVLEVLRNAQFVYGLSRYPKKQVLDDPVDVKALRERLEAMRELGRSGARIIGWTSDALEAAAPEED